MFGRRFFISWLVSSLIMFGAFYFWHGMILTDFERMAYPFGIFLSIAAVVYLFIGFLVNKVYELEYLNEKFQKRVIPKGLVAGAVCGLLLYMVTMVAGVSYSNKITMENILLDLSWQVVEGALGGFAVGISHILVMDDRVFED